jgi:phage-related protein (TIGR01555 family)
MAQRKTIDSRHRAVLLPDGTQTTGATFDSVINLAHGLGIGADNPTSTATYGYNPITRNRMLLEQIHRGSWLGGVAVDTVANDMTRAGVEFLTELDPDESEKIGHQATSLRIWDQVNETIRWGRLYGGAIAVALIDGQDLRTPLDPKTVGRKQFKGLLVLDRWMLEPTLDDLVTEYGPHLGLPRYYRVGTNAPALRGSAIHYSRVMLRHEGIQLPYQQRLTENLWGISVLERLYDRMIAFDSATTGAAQLVYKAYLRTLKIPGLRDIVSAGGAPMKGLHAYVNVMRRFQGIEGITMIDGEDTFEVQGHSAFSGLSDALIQFGQQLSGALQIPLVRLFGQSPAGLNATGESDLRMYYDHIKQQQVKDLHSGMSTTYHLLARSEGIELPETFALDFRSLWQIQDKEKADIAASTSAAVVSAVDAGLIGRKTALKELRQSGRVTGIFTNITQDLIEAADDEVDPPGGLELDDPLDLGVAGLGSLNQGEEDENGPDRTPGGAANGPRRRVELREPVAPGQ